jgi:hypothetical protein
VFGWGGSAWRANNVTVIKEEETDTFAAPLPSQTPSKRAKTPSQPANRKKAKIIHPISSRSPTPLPGSSASESPPKAGTSPWSLPQQFPPLLSPLPVIPVKRPIDLSMPSQPLDSTSGPVPAAPLHSLSSAAEIRSPSESNGGEITQTVLAQHNTTQTQSRSHLAATSINPTAPL